MRKRVIWLSVTALLLSMVLTACGQSKSGSTSNSSTPAGQPSAASNPTPASKPIKIGVAWKTEMQPRWRFENQIMEAQAKSLGVQLISQWANDDITKQTSQVENLLSQGITALIVVPVDDKAASSFVDKAHAAGVSVISYDIAIQNPKTDYFVTRNNTKVGTLQAEAALRFAQGKGIFSLVKGDQANNVAREIAQGWEGVLKPKIDSKDVQVVSDQWHKNWSPEDALKQAENALTASKDGVKAFVTANDGMASGVTQALKAQSLSGKVFVSGLDVDLANARLIVEGAQTMSVWTKIDDMAKAALDAAVALSKKEKPASEATTNGIPTKLIEVVEVNKDNMCEFITKIAPQGWMKAADVYKTVPAPAGCQ